MASAELVGSLQRDEDGRRAMKQVIYLLIDAALELRVLPNLAAV